MAAWTRRAALRMLVPFQGLLGTRGENAFGILMYHRVCEVVPNVPRPSFNVPPGRFRRQLAGLLKRGFQPWPLQKVLAHTEQGQPVPRNVFVVTFDDGYANNVTRALPILRELQVPATIFLATAYLDGTTAFPFDDWPPAGSDQVPPDCWQPMTRTQAHSLLDTGLIELGCHTHSHEVFLGRPDAFRSDLERSIDCLRREFGVERPTFAFPYGSINREMRQIARECDVRCSLSTYRTLVETDSDPFAWGRFGVDFGDTAGTVAAMLGGWYDALRDVVRGRRPRDNRSQRTHHAATQPDASVAR